ncbi:MAG: hypothetical protein C3F02_00450 [Parcubacteria group bacterium]|nr:MAG: hypothetical protein C3F02_00450 [Parcubacteria group bacterium]
MKLFTVTTTFADFTFAVEQYEVDSPEEAVEKHFKEAGCFSDYNRAELLDIMIKRLKDGSAIIHTKGSRGVWQINTGTEFLDFEGELEAIYGGLIIQTDPHGPRWS